MLGKKRHLLEIQAEDEEGGAGEADGSVRCQVRGLQEGERIIQGLQRWDRRCSEHSRGAGRKQECWVPLQRTSKGQMDNVSPCWKLWRRVCYLGVIWHRDVERSQNKNQGEAAEEWLYLSGNNRLEFKKKKI